MYSTACGAAGSSASSIANTTQITNGLKMVHGNDDAMNKIPLKSVTDDEEKNGGEFVPDTEEDAEEARREERRIKILQWMKKLTIGIICFIGIALICYVIISLCFSDWSQSTGRPKISATRNTTDSNTPTGTSPSISTNLNNIIPPASTLTNNTNNNTRKAHSIRTQQHSTPKPNLPSLYHSALLLSSDDKAEPLTSLPNDNNNTLESTLATEANDYSEIVADVQTTWPTATSNASPDNTDATATASMSSSTTKIKESSEPNDTFITSPSSTSPASPSLSTMATLKDIPITEENFTSTLGVYQNAAVCSDKHVCSEIGSKILQDGGSAVDSAIAALLCNGITTLHSMGIGGGMLMNIYIKSREQAFSVDGREVAPFGATQDMFHGMKNTSERGALAIAVPGELKGYHRAHEKFGILPWKQLVEPSIKVCREGFYLNKHIRYSAKNKIKYIQGNEMLRKMLYDETTGDIHPLGTKIMPWKELCHTYELLAENGPLDFYNGTLSKLVIEDLEEFGSLVTFDDLESYRADMVNSITMQLGHSVLYAVPPVSSGSIVANILSILEGFNFTKNDLQDDEHNAHTMHRMVEAMKFSFAKRWELGDVRFNDVRELVSRLTNPETGAQMRALINKESVLKSAYEYGALFSGEDDSGTSHLSVLAPNGDAVSATSSINEYFGSVYVGKRTGIIFNNGMNDFSIPGRKDLFNLPPSPTNFIDPQKRPMSSMSPMVLTDSLGNVSMVVGAAGGSKIISAIVEVMARVLWFGQNIKEAIDAPRFHHQLVPNVLEYEEHRFSEVLLKLLQARGHHVESYDGVGSVVCGIVRNETAIYANADYRKQGGTAGF